jgi:RHH-type proline utilization regulon transcriptional repressor/proline dehydrogenase/delta 1-pyrroline-5-carboxylate dehydrogenase
MSSAMAQPFPRALEVRTTEIASELHDKMADATPLVFQRNHITGRVMDWVMQDEEFKADVFRLVDVLPSLHTSNEIQAHAVEYLQPGKRTLPFVGSALLKFATSGIIQGITTKVVPMAVEEMAHQFIVSDDLKVAMQRFRELHDAGIGVTADLLDEVTLSNAEANLYQVRYRDLIETLATESQAWPENALVDKDHLGAIPRANVSIKLSALEQHLDPVDPSGSVTRLMERVLPLLLRAKEMNAFVNIDMESWDLHGIAFDFLEQALSQPELRSWPHIGIAVQAYLKSARADLDRLRALVDSRGAPIGVRLVKGAYWDHEIIRARQYGYPVPVLDSKTATDESFESLTTYLVEHYLELMPAFGTHNLRSIAHALAETEIYDVPKSAIEFQMLYGMAEPLRDALRDDGLRTRIYSPIGALMPGMAYLVRRLLENTSNEGFLKQTYVEKRDLGRMLTRPETHDSHPEPKPEITADLSEPFVNCPRFDFTDRAARDEFASIVRYWPESLPVVVPICIAGNERSSSQAHCHVSPNDRQQVVSQVSMASREDADEAVRIAAAAWPAWRDTPVETRAQYLEALAGRLALHRTHLAALEVHETGKPWAEADADVAEAIDFCRYYARRALVELAPAECGHAPGEVNHLFYEGRGPTVVIAPWNFPLSILCGMTAAALVTGNTVIMKPAEQASLTAYMLFNHMVLAGIPADVLHFLPGIGENIGPALVEHPLVAQVAFTGSREVGTAIRKELHFNQANQKHLKRMICEMGGKNAIVIDADADLDEVVRGVVTSAFGYAGQKCSACSRVIAVESIADEFLTRLIDAVSSLRMAPATDPSCQLGPVIDAAAHKRLNACISALGDDVKVIYRGQTDAQQGFFVPPLIVEVQDLGSRLMNEELFGPVLCFYRTATFEDAIDAANASDFALTGAVYSRRPSHIEMARARFRVGNLYINRGCTGAIVGRQPFGGFGMSGGGTKAGGPGYLLHFTDPRCVTENIVRRDFSPDMAT